MSNTIETAQYDAINSKLQISFTSNPKRVYTYDKVAPEVAQKLASAESKGSYFNSHIRNNYKYSVA